MLEIDKGAGRPESPRELLARDHVAGALEHHAQDFERLLLQTNAVCPFPQFAGPDVEFKGIEAQKAFRVHKELSPVRPPRCAADHRVTNVSPRVTSSALRHPSRRRTVASCETHGHVHWLSRPS